MSAYHAHSSRSNGLKRPEHPSPSYERTQYIRSKSSGVIKRARWDVSSPIPSPPVLSQPRKEENTGFSFASTSSAFHFQANPKSITHRNRHPVEPLVHIGSDEDDDGEQFRSAAFTRLRASTRNDGELFVERMREWEEKQVDQQEHSAQGLSHHNSLQRPFAAFGQTINLSHDHGGSSYHSNLGQSIPALSHSALTASSSGSGSGSDSFSGRKRSWSVVGVDEDDTAAEEGYEMDWEMVKRSKIDASLGTGILAPDDGDADFMAPSSSSSQHGDVESAMEDDEMEDDDDDDLIFVLNQQDQVTEPSRPPQFTSIVSTERMISELSQILDAGAGDLDGSGGFTSQDKTVDGGAFW